MTSVEIRPSLVVSKEVLTGDPDGLREVVRVVPQEGLEAEMTDAVGALKGERTDSRLGYRSGFYPRTLVTRVGQTDGG